MRYKRVLIFVFTIITIVSLSAGRVYAVESADGQTQDSVLYEVQKGDCLWKIAKEFLGDGSRYKALVTWNEGVIPDPNLIYPGMKLQISGNSFAQGVVNGALWESEWLGMRLELPEGFEFEDMEEFFNESYSVIEESDSEEPTDWEFIATNPSFFGSTIFLAAQQWDGSSYEFIEELKTEIGEQVTEDEEFEVVMSWSEEGTTMIGGRSFEHYYSEEEFMGFSICQHYYVTKVDDRIVLLFILYVGDMEKEIDAFLDGFSETN